MRDASKNGLFNWMPSKMYLKLKHKQKMGKKLNLRNPKTYNEKLQWLKLHNRNPEYAKMVDKVEAKKFFAEQIGTEYIIPTIGVWDKLDDIDFSSLPSQFALKCTHDSGGVVIVHDKDKSNKSAAWTKLKFHLKRNFYLPGRETL